MNAPQYKHDAVTVSIVMITYNHAEYIEQAIESILSQEANFPFEIVIGEDCSSDTTRQIILNYREKNPDRIRLVLQSQNVGMSTNALDTLRECRGKYLAFCEGDDYWTDRLKLQKQVDYMQAHPECTLSCGGYDKVDDSSGQRSVVNYATRFSKPGGFRFSLADMQKLSRVTGLTKTLTVMCRRDALSGVRLETYAYHRDVHLCYHAMKVGYGYYFDSIFGVYRVHGGGIYSANHGRVNQNVSYNCYKELFEKNRDEFTRQMYFKRTLSLLHFDLDNAYEENTLGRKAGLLREAIKTARTGNEYFLILRKLVPASVSRGIRRLLGRRSG